MTRGTLDITVLGAKNLKNTQMLGHQDPFFVVLLGNKHFTSPVANDMGRNPVWNARYSFETTNENKIYFTIRNRNHITADSMLGTAEIPLHRVYNEGKHDAHVQVVTASGQVQGELSVILLFNAHNKAPKSKGQGTTSHQQQSTGYQQLAPPPQQPIGYSVDPGMPTASAPSAPAVPIAASGDGYPIGGGGGAYPPQAQPQYPPQAYVPQPRGPPVYPGGQMPTAPPPPAAYNVDPRSGSPLGQPPGPYNQPPHGYAPPGVYPPPPQYGQPTPYGPPRGFPPVNYQGQRPGGLPPSGYPYYPAPHGAYFGPGTGSYSNVHGGKHKKHKKGKKSKFK